MPCCSQVFITNRHCQIQYLSVPESELRLAGHWRAFEMKLTDLKRTLDKIKAKQPNFEFELNESASEQLFEYTQNQLCLTIPEKTKEFFKTWNGLTTKKPDLTILGVEDWTKAENRLVHFSTFDKKNLL